MKTVTDPSIVMEQPQLPSPGLATFGSDSAIAEEEGAGDVGLSMEGEVRTVQYRTACACGDWPRRVV